MQSLSRNRLVAYLRVSTQKQGQSGLGLEAQDAAIEAYRRSCGGEIVARLDEVETGKRADRPELARAIREAKRLGAVLVIAKLDRLARNVAFVASLMESGVEFVACDNPTANRLTVHILAAVAEDEARRIGQRTADALAAYRARGGRLGASREGAHRFDRSDALRGSEAAARARSGRSMRAYAAVAGDVLAWRRQGLGYRDIARRLNEAGLRTPNGAEWGPGQVGRVLEKFAEKAGA